MANITLTLPDELHARMQKYSAIRWSDVVCKSIAQKVELLEMMDKIAQKSKLTEKNAKELSDKINKKMAQRFRGMP